VSILALKLYIQLTVHPLRIKHTHTHSIGIYGVLTVYTLYIVSMEYYHDKILTL